MESQSQNTDFSMESQSQNTELRYNSENFHPFICTVIVVFPGHIHLSFNGESVTL